MCPAQTDPAADHPTTFRIQIDRQHIEVHQAQLTGAQLRQLHQPPIGADHDLFEVVPGGPDRKIGDTQEVPMRNGLRFFSAPTQINPGTVYTDTEGHSDAIATI